MKTVSMVMQKGGAGKTTICDQLAYNLKERGYKVAVQDLDDQQGSYFENYLAEDEEPDIMLVDTRGALDAGIVLDGQNVTIGDIIESSDLVIIPYELQEDCARPCARVVNICNERGVPYRILFNKVDMRRVTDQIVYQEVCQTYPGHLFKTSIRQGTAVGAARLLKTSINNTNPGSNPAKDFANVTDELLGVLNG